MRGKSSTQLHIQKTRKGLFCDRPSKAKKIVLVSIVLLAITVIATVIAIPLLDPEHRVKSTISSLATDYYENYFYQDYANSGADMTKYETYGFAPVSLRQLLFYDPTKVADSADFLRSYCDENHTFVKFYPKPPYSKTSYRTEYTYSCSF